MRSLINGWSMGFREPRQYRMQKHTKDPLIAQRGIHPSGEIKSIKNRMLCISTTNAARYQYKNL